MKIYFIISFLIVVVNINNIEANPFGLLRALSANTQNQQNSLSQGERNRSLEFVKTVLVTPLYGPGISYKFGLLSRLFRQFQQIPGNNQQQGSGSVLPTISKTLHFNRGITVNNPVVNNAVLPHATVSTTQISSSVTANKVSNNADLKDMDEEIETVANKNKDVEKNIENVFEKDTDTEQKIAESEKLEKDDTDKMDKELEKDTDEKDLEKDDSDKKVDKEIENDMDEKDLENDGSDIKGVVAELEKENSEKDDGKDSENDTDNNGDSELALDSAIALIHKADKPSNSKTISNFTISTISRSDVDDLKKEINNDKDSESSNNNEQKVNGGYNYGLNNKTTESNSRSDTILIGNSGGHKGSTGYNYEAKNSNGSDKKESSSRSDTIITGNNNEQKKSEGYNYGLKASNNRTNDIISKSDSKSSGSGYQYEQNNQNKLNDAISATGTRSDSIQNNDKNNDKNLTGSGGYHYAPRGYRYTRTGPTFIFTPSEVINNLAG